MAGTYYFESQITILTRAVLWHFPCLDEDGKAKSDTLEYAPIGKQDK